MTTKDASRALCSAIGPEPNNLAVLTGFAVVGFVVS